MNEKESTDTPLQTRTHTYQKQDGIIFGRVMLNAEIGLADAKEDVAAVRKISGDCVLPLLIDMRSIHSISHDAREYYGKNEHSSAVVLLIHSPVSRIIGNFFLGLNKPKVPMKLFSSETEALKWLSQYKHNL